MKRNDKPNALYKSCRAFGLYSNCRKIRQCIYSEFVLAYSWDSSSGLYLRGNLSAPHT